MGRRRSEDAGRFELGGQWLGRERGRPNWFRYWYDERRGRVSRRSLGTEDLEEAKALLAGYVLTQPRPTIGGKAPPPSEVLLVSVLNHYLDHRAESIRSGDQAGRAAQLVTQYLFEVRELPKSSKADVFTLDLQEDFIRWSAATFRHSASYIARVLNPIAAAMHFASQEQAIDDDDGRRVVRLMSEAPRVRYDANWIAEIAGIPAPVRRKWVPSIEEMARFIDCVRSEHIFRYLIIALNTWGRAETIMELDFKKQVDLRTGLIDLNPPGRRQTEKRRPEIRLTRNLRAWHEKWKASYPLAYKGETVGNVKKAMQHTNARWMMAEAGVPAERVEELMRKANSRERTQVLRELELAGAQRITRRVIRSFMATRVRGVKEVRVDREQRQLWLGHLDQDTTSRYEITDPDYLREAAEATDVVIEKVGRHCKRSLWPASTQLSLSLGSAPRIDGGT